MDKSAILSWLGKLHSRRAKLNLIYPDIPHIGQFLQFSNEFCWTVACYQEMIGLERASGLSFDDYFVQTRGPLRWPRTSFGIPPKTMEKTCNCRYAWGDVSTADTVYGASAYDQASSQDSSPRSESICKVGSWRTKRVHLRPLWRITCLWT